MNSPHQEPESTFAYLGPVEQPQILEGPLTKLRPEVLQARLQEAFRNLGKPKDTLLGVSLDSLSENPYSIAKSSQVIRIDPIYFDARNPHRQAWADEIKRLFLSFGIPEERIADFLNPDYLEKGIEVHLIHILIPVPEAKTESQIFYRPVRLLALIAGNQPDTGKVSVYTSVYPENPTHEAIERLAITQGTKMGQNTPDKVLKYLADALGSTIENDERIRQQIR